MTEENIKEYIEILNDRKNTPTDIAKKAAKFWPEKLYRYRSFDTEYWEREIFKGEIYLAQASILNDPMDCLMSFDHTKLTPDCKLVCDSIRDCALTYHVDDVTPEEVITQFKDEKNKRQIFEGFRSDIRIASFSERRDLLLMWSHYADMHKGFCIEYKTQKLGWKISGRLYPVIYSSEKPDVTDAIKDSTNAVMKGLVHKASEWEYEREWRAMTRDDNSGFKFRELSAIEAVYLGVNCSESNRGRVVQWARHEGKKVIQMKTDLNSYKLIEEQIV